MSTFSSKRKEDQSFFYAPQVISDLQTGLSKATETIGILNKRVENLERTILAERANRHICKLNRQRGPYNLLPLQKLYVDAGSEHVRQIFGSVPHEAGLMIPTAIGTQPGNFKPNMSEYTDLDLARLIMFYNEPFDITPQDTLEQKAQKILARFTGEDGM